MLIESLSGVRGYDTDFTEPFVRAYARAFSNLLSSPIILIGRDTRASGRRIFDLLAETLVAAGKQVVDLGICPTPTVQFEVEHLAAGGGIVITASHNPLPWNGLKFVGPDGMFLSADEMAELKTARQQLQAQPSVPSCPGGRLTRYSAAIDDHIAAVIGLPYLTPQQIQERRFKVVVDAVNGAAWRAIPELLAKLGVTVIPIHCEADKPFPHPPEPLPQNLTGLCQAVGAHDADLGLAIDPDGDRLAVINAGGKPISEEYTLVLAAELVLSHHPGTDNRVVTNLSTTMAVDDVARRYGATVIRTPIGEINVARRMKTVGARIGGEGNGGVILPDAHLGRDSLVATALVLQLLAERNCTLTEILKTIPRYQMVKQKVPRGDIEFDPATINALRQLAQPEAINTEDGLKMSWSDRWIHMRLSNTEPIVRIYAEAPDEAAAEGVIAPFVDYFKHRNQES